MSTQKGTAEADWQRVWLSARTKQWTSLAIVPSDPGVDSASVAQALAATGRVHAEKPVRCLSALGVQLGRVHQFIEELNRLTGRGDWVIVPVDPIAENPSAVPVAQATSAVLLVVRLGDSLLDSAKAAIEAVGRDRFLGSIVLGARNGTGSFQATLPG